MRRIVLIILLCVFAFNLEMLGKVNRPNSENFLRGLDALQKENYRDAYDYFAQEIRDNPENGYAYAFISTLFQSQNEYGQALTAVNNALKYIPKKDSEYVGFAYKVRSDIYLVLQDTTNALKDLNQAIKVRPDCQSYYEARGQVYYEMNDFDNSDADYQKIISLDAGSVMGYMGLGRNLNAKGQWNAAIEQFNIVEKMHSDYAKLYSFRAESYIGLNDWNSASDDIIKALAIDNDNKAFHLMLSSDPGAFRLMEAKLKIQMTKSPGTPKWPYDLGILCENNKKYRKAIDYYTKANAIKSTPTVEQRIAQCYDELGMYNSAISHIKKAIEMDSTEYDYVASLADIQYGNGQGEAAIATMSDYISHNPESFAGYYERGFLEDNMGKIEEAIDDYTLAITLNPKAVYAYRERGDLYSKQGESSLATADYKKVIELSKNNPNEATKYAYLFLGDKQRAIAMTDSCINKNPKNPSAYYEAACIYALMGESDKAISYLRTCLDLGYKNINHIYHDDDLSSLRDNTEFQNLVAVHKNMIDDETEAAEAEDAKKAAAAEEKERLSAPNAKPKSKKTLKVHSL